MKDINWCISEINNLSRKYNSSEDRLSEAKNYYLDTQSLAKSVYHLMTEMLNVSVDVHLKEPHSWAVICIKGKPEYIKFINLGKDCKTARDIMMWLRQFEGSNITIDSPFTRYFRDEINNWEL
jgi:hypothetical protein